MFLENGIFINKYKLIILYGNLESPDGEEVGSTLEPRRDSWYES